MTQHKPLTLQTAIACGVVLTGLGLAVGAVGISSAAGYGGVGPNFLPWLVAIALMLCGAFMLWESRTGGFRAMVEPDGVKPCWSGFAWMSAGLLANAALITSIGFILSCSLCFVLAVQGLRGAQAKADVMGIRPATLVKDALIGMAIAAPVFWLFTQFLAINLPGLTSTGWL